MLRADVVLGVALIAFLAAFAGVVLILSNRTWSPRSLRWGVGFGAGLLIGISLMEIIPTAIDLAGQQAMVFVLLGFACFFLVEKFTLVHHFERQEDAGGFRFSLATFAALCLHGLMDGIVTGLGLHFNEAFGLVVFMAILFHKMPLAVSVAGIFLANTPKRKAVLQMLIFALSTPVGLVVAVVLLGGLSREVIGTVVALSAGIFIYLGATDMLPEISHAGEAEAAVKSRPWTRWVTWEPTFFVLIGMMVSFVPHVLLEGVLRP